MKEWLYIFLFEPVFKTNKKANTKTERDRTTCNRADDKKKLIATMQGL